MYKNDEFGLTGHLDKKILSFKIRVTTFIQGDLKNKFLKDCMKRGKNESIVAQHIIETYYKALNNVPGLNEKEPNEIQKYIIDKIKLPG